MYMSIGCYPYTLLSLLSPSVERGALLTARRRGSCGNDFLVHCHSLAPAFFSQGVAFERRRLGKKVKFNKKQTKKRNFSLHKFMGY